MAAAATAPITVAAPPPAPRSARGPMGKPGSTLEEMILGVWEDLAARGRAECPVCAAKITRWGCGGCGASLS